MEWFFNRAQGRSGSTTPLRTSPKNRRSGFSSDTDVSPLVALTGLYTNALKGEDSTAQHTCVKGADHLTMMLVADGHGGAQTAMWLQDNLLPKIDELAHDGSQGALQKACVDAFAFAHAKVKTLEAKPSAIDFDATNTSTDTVEDGPPMNASGATCTICIFNHGRREITCANVGDSEAFLVSESGLEALTTSHRLEVCESEQQRLRAQEIQLAFAMDRTGQPHGPLRAWPGGLAVTRGIGDGDCEPIVSCEPSIKTISAPDGGGCILACSDGVW